VAAVSTTGATMDHAIVAVMRHLMMVVPALD
jgi:hypothetical protein